MTSRCAVFAGLCLALAGCSRSDVGFVEIKTAPITVTPPAFYLDATKLEPIKNGVAVLRQRVGTWWLQIDGGAGQLAMLCEVVIKKDRITSVTVSVLDRRCQCANNRGTDAASNRTCVS